MNYNVRYLFKDNEAGELSRIRRQSVGIPGFVKGEAKISEAIAAVLVDTFNLPSDSVVVVEAAADGSEELAVSLSGDKLDKACEFTAKPAKKPTLSYPTVKQLSDADKTDLLEMATVFAVPLPINTDVDSIRKTLTSHFQVLRKGAKTLSKDESNGGQS